MIDYQVKAEVRILPDAPAVANRCAQKFVEIAAAAVKEKGSFEVALSGGSTPKLLYSLLVDDPTLSAQVPWDKMHLFFGDERHVKPDHLDSNFRMAREAMFSKSPLKPEQVTRIKGEYPEAKDAAQEYDQVGHSHVLLLAEPVTLALERDVGVRNALALEHFHHHLRLARQHDLVVEPLQE